MPTLSQELFMPALPLAAAALPPLPPLPPLLPGSPNLDQLHAALGLIDADAPAERSLALRAADGVRLAAQLYEPVGPARAVAVLAPATGVPQRFYRPFCQWLSRQGYAVLSLDYRGLAASRCPEGRTDQASMRDWMLLDLPAALQAGLRRARQDGERLPLLWVGHSLGGHALALLDGVENVDAVITLGSQLPAFARWPAGHARWGARFFFQAWLPLMVGLFGRLPAWALGGGLSLPAPAARDWSRWGQMPNYFASDPGLQLQAARFRGVAQLWCVADDWVFGPEPAVQALADRFAPGHAELLRLTPAEVGLKQLGHFGAFRREAEARLWPLLLARIEAAVPALQSGARRTQAGHQ
jgi:predicted alpha/beta hydrolase